MYEGVFRCVAIPKEERQSAFWIRKRLLNEILRRLRSMCFVYIFKKTQWLWSTLLLVFQADFLSTYLSIKPINLAHCWGAYAFAISVSFFIFLATQLIAGRYKSGCLMRPKCIRLAQGKQNKVGRYLLGTLPHYLHLKLEHYLRVTKGSGTVQRNRIGAENLSEIFS